MNRGYCTYEPLRGRIYSGHVGRNMVDKGRVGEFRSCFPRHVYTSLVYAADERGTSEKACSHRPPEELVLGHASCHGRAEQPDSHAHTWSNARRGFARRFRRSMRLTEVDDSLQVLCQPMVTRPTSLSGVFTFTRSGPINCEVSPSTLNSPPSQNDSPRTSFNAQARLAFLRPSTVRQRCSKAARRALNPEPGDQGPLCHRQSAMKNHLKRSQKPG